MCVCVCSASAKCSDVARVAQVSEINPLKGCYFGLPFHRDPSSHLFCPRTASPENFSKVRESRGWRGGGGWGWGAVQQVGDCRGVAVGGEDLGAAPGPGHPQTGPICVPVNPAVPVPGREVGHARACLPGLKANGYLRRGAGEGY